MLYHGDMPLLVFGIEFLFKLAFAIITLFVGYYANKVYKLTGEEKPRCFGRGFLFISVSYFIQALLDLLIYLQAVADPMAIHSFATGVQIVFYLLGLITIAFMTLDTKDWKAYSLLIILTMMAFVFSFGFAQSIFYLISTVLLIYIIGYYIAQQRSKGRVGFILTAFIFLLLSNIDFLLIPQFAILAIVGPILELVAYFLVLLNLLAVFQK